MLVSRRSLIQAAPLAVAALAVAPKNVFAERITPPPPASPDAEVTAYGTGQSNLSAKLYGSGASAADFRQAWVSLSTLSSTLNTNGTYSFADNGIRSQSSAVNAASSSSFDPYTMLATVQKFVPSAQLSSINNAIAQVNASSKASLLNSGTLAAIQQYISTLEACETAVGSGVATVKYGIQRRPGIPALREVNVCGPAVIGAVLALGAIFAPEVEIGIMLGVALSFSDYLLIGSVLYQMSAALTC